MKIDGAILRRDELAREVIYNGQRIRFVPSEWRVLARLCECSPGIVTRGEIDSLLGDGCCDAYARITIYQLRRKLKPLPIKIQNIWNSGWRLVQAAPDKIAS